MNIKIATENASVQHPKRYLAAINVLRRFIISECIYIRHWCGEANQDYNRRNDTKLLHFAKHNPTNQNSALWQCKREFGTVRNLQHIRIWKEPVLIQKMHRKLCRHLMTNNPQKQTPLIPNFHFPQHYLKYYNFQQKISSNRKPNLSDLIWVQNNSINCRTAFIFPLATWCPMPFR